MPQRMTRRTWIVLLTVAVLFGSSFILIKIAVDSVPPMTLAAGRAVLAAPLVWLFLKATGGRLPPFGVGWWPFLLLGILTGVIPFTTIAWGQLHIESGLGGILFGTIPVFSAVLAPLMMSGERFSTSRMIGALIGLGGVVLVIGVNALSGIGDQLLGVAVTLAAAMSYTLGAIYARTRSDIPPTAAAAGQLLVAALVLVAASAIIDAPWTLSPPPMALGAVAVVAVFSTAIPMVLLFWLVREAGPTSASLMTLFMPVVAVAVGAVALGEQLPWQAFIGLGLILLGAASVDGRLPVLRPRSAERV